MKPADNYITAHFGIKSWLLTVDHKRIALLYLIAITFFFFLGGAFAVMIRLELLTPEGDLFQPETYNKLFTMHGIIMVFFFLIPSIPATLGNFLVPLMIGARDLAFPRLNLASWYIFMVGGCFTVFAAIFGGIDTGLDLLHALQQHVFEYLGAGDRGRHLHHRILVHSHRTEFHRHDPHHAGARTHLVPPAAVHLVELCRQPDHGSGHARWSP